MWSLTTSLVNAGDPRGIPPESIQGGLTGRTTLGATVTVMGAEERPRHWQCESLTSMPFADAVARVANVMPVWNDSPQGLPAHLYVEAQACRHTVGPGPQANNHPSHIRHVTGTRPVLPVWTSRTTDDLGLRSVGTPRISIGPGRAPGGRLPHQQGMRMPDLGAGQKPNGHFPRGRISVGPTGTLAPKLLAPSKRGDQVATKSQGRSDEQKGRRAGPRRNQRLSHRTAR